MQYEQGGWPLTAGGLRYTIHPVTGQLLTTEVQPMTKDLNHKPHREDKTIIKARHSSSFPVYLLVAVTLGPRPSHCGNEMGYVCDQPDRHT